MYTMHIDHRGYDVIDTYASTKIHILDKFIFLLLLFFHSFFSFELFSNMCMPRCKCVTCVDMGCE